MNHWVGGHFRDEHWRDEHWLSQIVEVVLVAKDAIRLVLKKTVSVYLEFVRSPIVRLRFDKRPTIYLREEE